jgi:uncharacterized protein (TIGR04168 family)
MSIRLAVVGDVHLSFGPADVAHVDEAGYDAALFVGDLSGYRVGGALKVARYVAQLRTRAFVIPGNHDTVGAPQLVAELTQNQAAIDYLSAGQADRVEALRSALGAATLTGYSRHVLQTGSLRVQLIAARPHSFGGPTLSFRPYLSQAFGVTSLDDSAARLCRLVDESEPGVPIVFLAHNGPAGLGDRRHHIWGCDFRRSEGDFGDPDLEVAIAHARDEGRRVLAVIAGHMHHALRGGGQREWQVERDGTLYVNAARVPRVWKEGGRERRHVLEVVLEEHGATAREVVFP